MPTIAAGPTNSPLVRRTRPDESGAVSTALAAAFDGDPVFTWILPDRASHGPGLQAFFGLVVEALAPHDDTWSTRTTASGVVGAALWVPHGRAPMSEEQEERFGAACVALCGPHGDRVLALMAAMDGRHPAEPHEYLWFLGVAPAVRGWGLGSALMVPVLERADRRGHPAYLEATTERSKALYERHGFRADAPFAPADGPPLWPMWREPRQRDGSEVTAPRRTVGA